MQDIITGMHCFGLAIDIDRRVITRQMEQHIYIFTVLDKFGITDDLINGVYASIEVR